MSLRAAILAFVLLTLPASAGLVGWDTAAWPACGHIGSREIEPGLLYKQRWAADVFAAIEERRGAALRNNWGGAGATTAESWWTASGVTNRVVAYEREVLAEAKRLTRYLAQFYLNTARVDPLDFEADWLAWAATQRSTNTTTITGADWTWGCPPTVHSGTDATITRLTAVGTSPGWSLTAPTNAAGRVATIEGALDLPASALTWTPWRLWEGICNPTASYLGASLVFRSATVTGICNTVTLGTVTADDGAAAAQVVANPCISANGNDLVVVHVTNSGSVTATAVRVRFTVDSRLLLASPYGTQARAIPAFHAWRGAEVTAEMGDIPPGATRTVVQLNLTLAGYQGDSPHAGDAWYATDFGWDVVRKALTRMTAIAYPNPASPNDPSPEWFAPDYERWEGTGQSFSGNWSAALSALAGDITYEPEGTYDPSDEVGPGMEFTGTFGAYSTTGCLWTASFDSGRAPAYFESPWAYPDGVGVAVDWYTEIISTTGEGTGESADIAAIETLTWTADGSTAESALSSEKAGGDVLASETAPGDPVNGPDFGDPNEDNEVQDNITLNRRTYSSAPIAVVRFTFTHREDP